MVEGRLFSEGLHVLGQPPGPGAMRQYLEAYFDGALPDEALDAVAASDGGGARSADGGLAAVRAQLERVFQRVRRLLLQNLNSSLVSYHQTVQTLDSTVTTPHIAAKVRARQTSVEVPAWGMLPPCLRS